VVEDPLVIDFYEALAIQEEQIAAVMDVMTK
jgi:hypothetical protein